MVVILPGFLAQSTLLSDQFTLEGYVGPILMSSPRTRSDNRVTNSVLNTHEKKMSGSELEPKANATQSSRRDDMLTHLIAPNEITRSAAILS